jgi:predicted transcriptional regulator
LLTIQIISATPGPTTTEKILESILAHPQGITVKEISSQLNRPVSMIDRCLKFLISSKQIYVRLSPNGMQKICYPTMAKVGQ